MTPPTAINLLCTDAHGYAYIGRFDLAHNVLNKSAARMFHQINRSDKPHWFRLTGSHGWCAIEAPRAWSYGHGTDVSTITTEIHKADAMSAGVSMLK